MCLLMTICQWVPQFFHWAASITKRSLKYWPLPGPLLLGVCELTSLLYKLFRKGSVKGLRIRKIDMSGNSFHFSGILTP